LKFPISAEKFGKRVQLGWREFKSFRLIVDGAIGRSVDLMFTAP
jgi:hypothetical protein